MNERFQRRIQRYGWDKAAAFYETGWQKPLAPAHRALMQLAAPRPGESALDMACGTGMVTFPLADAVGPEGQVLATDLSDAMVEIVRQIAEEDYHRQVEAFRADAEKLTAVGDRTFDLVTCALGLMYCPNPLNALREAFRVLLPGGRAVFAVWGNRSKCGWAEIFPIVDAEVQSTVCPMFFHLGAEDMLAGQMIEAGFSSVRQRRLQCTLPYDNAQAAADAALLGGPVALAYSRFEPATKERVRRTYLDSIRSHQNAHGFAIPGEFVICHGIKR